jgi:hypothetical protein
MSLLSAQGFQHRNGEPWTRRQVPAILSRGEFYEKVKFRYGAVEGIIARIEPACAWLRFVKRSP